MLSVRFMHFTCYRLWISYIVICGQNPSSFINDASVQTQSGKETTCSRFHCLKYQKCLRTGSLVYTSPAPKHWTRKTNHWASHASAKSRMGFRSRPGAGPSGDASWYLKPAEVTELPTSELGFHPCQGNLTTSYLLLVPMAQENAKSGDSKKGPASSKEKLDHRRLVTLAAVFYLSV